MDVRLPNGKLIKGVPEGTSKDEIAQKAIAAGLAFPEDFGIKPEMAASPDSIGDNALDVAGEFSAGANDAVMTFADTAAGALNAIQGGLRGLGTLATGGGLNAAVQQTRTQPIPKPSDVVEDATGFRPGQGGFMEPGLARDAVNAAGQAATMAGAAVPVAGRNVASVPGAVAEFAGAGSAAPVGQAVTISDKVARDLALKNQSGDVVAAGFKLDDAGNTVKDSVQQKALKAGVDEGIVSMLAASPKAARPRMLKMLDYVESGQKNKMSKAANRPQNVVGESLADLVNVLVKENKQAASQLNSVAKSLQGKRVDVGGPVNSFLSKLDDAGVTFDGLTPNFQGSIIEGAEDAENIVKRIVARMRDTKAPDAYDVHRLKRWIDQQVSYGGKSQEGLKGEMKGIIKTLRHDLDAVLDSKFPEYNRVNTVYAETIGPLNELQDLAGKRVNIEGDKAAKALGTLARRIVSNAQSSTAVQEVAETLHSVAKKYSSDVADDDIFRQVVFSGELDAMFGTGARNSFQGQTEAGTRGVRALRGPSDFIAEEGAKVIDRALSKTDKDKLRAMREILSN